jgi:hypothetical protein
MPDCRRSQALLGWVLTDCDGPIAADKIEFSGADLDRLVPNPPDLVHQPEAARGSYGPETTLELIQPRGVDPTPITESIWH